MITRALISFVVLLAVFASAVKYDVLRYNKVLPDYFIKSERYAYNDTIQHVDIAMVGTSLSAHYNIQLTGMGLFQNMSMTGRSATDGIGVICASGKYPKVLLIETNLFDNGADSIMVEKVFYPVVGEVKKNAFFFQREYKLHHLLPKSFYTINEKIMGSIATKTKLYSEYAKAQSQANITWQENYVRQYNVQFHSTLNDTLIIYNRYKLLKKQVEHLQGKGVKVILFETPVANTIEYSERTKYKRALIEKMANELSLPYVSAVNVAEYQKYLAKGDGIHMTSSGVKAYEHFLCDTLPHTLTR
jgi:hypothetical protein